MWLPIKSASMPKFDPMHRICQSPIICKPALERDLVTNSLTIGRDWNGTTLIRCACDSALSSEHVETIATHCNSLRFQ